MTKIMQFHEGLTDGPPLKTAKEIRRVADWKRSLVIRYSFSGRCMVHPAAWVLNMNFGVVSRALEEGRIFLYRTQQLVKWTRNDKYTQQCLELVDVKVPIQIIHEWTDRQCEHAEAYAGSIHLAASDNPIEPMPMPEHVRKVVVNDKLKHVYGKKEERVWQRP